MTHLLPLRLAAGEQAEGRKDDESTKRTSANDVPPGRVGDQRWDERVGQGEPDGEEAQPDSCDATPREHGKQQWQRQNTGLLKARAIFEIQHTHVKKRKEKGNRPHEEQACSNDVIGNTREILRLAQEGNRWNQEIDEHRRAKRDSGLADDGMQRNTLPIERCKPDRDVSIQRSHQQEAGKAEVQGDRDHQEIEAQAQRHHITDGFPKDLIHRANEQHHGIHGLRRHSCPLHNEDRERKEQVAAKRTESAPAQMTSKRTSLVLGRNLACHRQRHVRSKQGQGRAAQQGVIGRGDGPGRCVGKGSRGVMPACQPDPRCQRDEHRREAHCARRYDEDVLHYARALTGQHSGEQKDHQKSNALLPGLGQPLTIESLDPGNAGGGSVDNRENAWQPGADADKEAPACSQSVSGPREDRAFVGKHPGQLRHHKGARNEKGTPADDPVEKPCGTASSNGWYCFPSSRPLSLPHIMLEQANKHLFHLLLTIFLFIDIVYIFIYHIFIIILAS